MVGVKRGWPIVGAILALLGAVTASQAAVNKVRTAASSTTTTATAGSLFGCQAGVAPVFLGSATTPLIDVGQANPKVNPCVDASSTVQSTPLALPSANLNLGSVGPAGAYTYIDGKPQSTSPPTAAAVANVQAVNLDLGSSGTLTIVGPVQADVAYTCLKNKLESYSQSTLDVIYVNGQKTTLPAPGTPDTIQLGGGAYIAVNQRIQTATSLTENILDVHLANGAQVIVGQAQVTANGTDVCANTAPPNNGPTSNVTPFPLICPKGSVIDNKVRGCVIELGNGKIIYVSKPFRGPEGGTVYALSFARKHYHSLCLYGHGPKYALVVTKPHGRARGTLRGDRIIGRGAFERIAGLGGNDCIDGQGRNVIVFDGNGNDRIYVHIGRNKVGAGGGANKVFGGRGFLTLRAANGSNRVVAAKGGSRINLGIGRNRVFGSSARNRIFDAGDNGQISCGGNPRSVAYVRLKAANFARHHGCAKVRVIN